MQATRLARVRVPLALSSRRFATATAHPGAGAPTQAAPSVVVSLSNVEAQWEKLSSEEQLAVHQQLEGLQKKDWKTLSIDEKKAGELLDFV